MKSIYPLYELDSNATTPIRIARGVSIIRNEIDPDNINTRNVSEIDKYHITSPELCLQVDEKVISPPKASMAFIISCRLLKRTKVFISYRVNSNNEIFRVKDTYPFVRARNTTTIIEQQEFETIAKMYSGLNIFRALNKRTENAFYFLGLAYISLGWLESVIFHVCALETLTSASNRECDITKKFKNRIHKFTGYNKDKLEKIYGIRSKLVHGRYSHKPAIENLKLHRIAEAVCRKMFTKILLTPNYLNAFKNDVSRMKLF